MKFFVAFAALLVVAAAAQVPQPPSIQPVFAPGEDHPVVGPALVDHPAIGPVFVENELVQPGFGPALVDSPSVGPVFVEHEHEQPGFGPALVDFPVNAEAGSPVVIGPIPEGSSPLVQIIVNIVKSVGEAGVGAGASLPSIEPEFVQDIPAVGPAIIEDWPISGVEVADLPAAPVSPVQIGNPEFPAINIPQDLN